MRKQTYLTLWIFLTALMCAYTPTVSAQDAKQRYKLDIEENTLGAVMEALHQQTGQLLLYSHELSAVKGVSGLSGNFTIAEAMEIILTDTGLTSSLTESGMMVITRKITKGEDRQEDDVTSGKTKATLLTTISAAILGTGSPAEAQSNDAPQEQRPTSEAQVDQARTIDEIIVTATRRETTLLETPFAISAFGENFLEERGIVSIDDLVSLTPSLSDRNPQFGTSSGYTIRGVQAQNLSAATVGVYLDDVPLTFSGGTNEPTVRAFDLERVEVLRGPQGTLYGAGAMGGAIRYISNSPDATQTKAKVRGELSSTRRGGESYALDGMINLPIVKDKLALRVTASQQDDAGWIDIETAQGGPFEDANTKELTSVRGVLRFTPNEKLTLDAQIWHQENSFEGLNVINTASTSIFEDDAEIGPLSFGETDFTQYAGKLSYDFGWAEVVSTTGYYETEQVSEFTDGNFGGSISQSLPFNGFSHETRLVSNSDGPLNWIVGVFYQDAELKDESFALSALPISLNGNQKREQKSVFGEITYNFSEEFSATAGLRYFDEDVTANSVANIFGMVSEDIGDASYSDTSPKFLLQYTPSKNLNFYASASEGFRVGGSNLVTEPSDPGQYDPDSIWSYELGTKFALPDSRFQGGIAAFHNDWSNIQVFTPAPSGFTNIVTNAGGATITGVEAEFSWEATEGLVFGANGSILDAKFSDDAVVVGGMIADGDRINRIPENSFALFLDYSRPLSDKLDFGFHLDGAFRGNKVFLDQSELADSSNLWNMRTSLSYDDIEVGLFARNLFDDDTLDRFNAFYFGTPRPRTIGVDLTADF